MRYLRSAFPLWLVVAGLHCFGETNPQGQPFTCVANTGTPVIVRVEGITELVGDLLLQCTGGTPTPAGKPIPLTNLRLTLNTNVTSTLLPGGSVDALLLIDNPYPPATVQVPSFVTPPQNTPPQIFCPSVYGCPGLGAPQGQSPYVARSASTVYVARSGAANAVEWDGVPIDAPGTVGVRIVRITNVRANATQLGLSSTLIPIQIVGFIENTGGQFFAINNPQQTLATISQGLPPSAISAPTLVSLPHCQTHDDPSHRIQRRISRLT